MWGTTGGWKKGKIINMDFILKNQMNRDINIERRAVAIY